MHIIYQSTYFIEYFIQGNFKYPRIKKIHQIIEKITRIDYNVKILSVLLSHELLSTKIYYISIYIFYKYYSSQDKTSSKIQKLSKSNKYIKRYQQNKIEFFGLYIYICNSFQFKVTREVRLI